jgi:phosphatidylglycerophosphate synthase
MASTPILSYWIVTEHYTLAIWGCTFAAISDALDGYIAKKYNMGTTVGAYAYLLFERLDDCACAVG